MVLQLFLQVIQRLGSLGSDLVACSAGSSSSNMQQPQ